MKNEKKNLTLVQKALACLYVGAFIGTINSASLIIDAKDSIESYNLADNQKEQFISEVASGDVKDLFGGSYLDYYKANIEKSLLKMYNEKSTSVVRNQVLDNTGKHDVVNYIESQPVDTPMLSEYVQLEKSVSEKEENMFEDILQAMASVVTTGATCYAIANLTKKHNNRSNEQNAVAKEESIEEIVAENSEEDDMCATN